MSAAVRGLILVVPLLVPLASLAEGPAVRQDCGSDIQQYCARVQPGEGRLRDCIREHFNRFPEPCKEALLSNVAVVKACKPDVERTCPGVQPGGGRIQNCMKDHFAEYSERCQQAIITAKFGAR